MIAALLFGVVVVVLAAGFALIWIVGPRDDGPRRYR